MSQITLPSWVRPMAELHATSVAEDELGLNPDTPEYDKAFEKAFYEFCEEFYTHSLIPYAGNPSLSAKNAFLPFTKLFFRDDASWAGKHNLDKSERENIERMIIRSVGNIVKIYMKKEIAMPSSFKGAKGYDALAERQKARYIRLAVTSMLMAMVQSLFNIKKNEFLPLAEKFIADVSFSKLNSTASQQVFSTKIMSGVFKGFNLVSVLDEIEKEFGRKGLKEQLKETKATFQQFVELPKRKRTRKKSNPDNEPEAPSVDDYIEDLGEEIAEETEEDMF